MNNVTAVVDLQFGSTGKGLLAGMLSQRNEYDVVVSANMPNAGHTFVDRDGTPWVNKVLPSGVYSPALEYICIGPGAVFDPNQLEVELKQLAMRNIAAHRVVIHPSAGILLPEHREAEAALSGISSTMQGSMEAMVHKMRRPTGPDAPIAGLSSNPLVAKLVVSVSEWNRIMRGAKNILVEGSQGYSLGINAGFYPYCTSRDCTVWRLLADCAVAPVGNLKVIGSARCHPIRVGNTANGWSGPHYPDQKEISWDDIGVPAEMTTVTKRERRVFTFSKMQIEEAMMYNRVDEVFLNFCNYDPAAVPGIVAQINASYRAVMGGHLNPFDFYPRNVVRYMGFGPAGDDVLDVAPMALNTNEAAGAAFNG